MLWSALACVLTYHNVKRLVYSLRNMESAKEVKNYITTALENEDFLDYEITLTGSGEKSEGYAGDIIFATVLGTTVEGVKNIELAVKCSKKNFFEIYKSSYKRESYVYDVILPEFYRFQIDRGIKDIFRSVPKCYKVISEKSAEVLVMEDLRKSGYDLYDRKKPLDINHLKLVLREYGKLHAISFAMRDKKREDFEKIVADFDDVTLEYASESFTKLMQQGMERTCAVLKKMNNVKMYEVFFDIYRKGSDIVLMEILECMEPESAILHGDCWNSNFLYKYELEDKGRSSVPSEVAIIDWQMCRLHSPILDLSYFIYSTSSEEQLEHFSELLDTYYNSFATFLKELRCDPEKLFPYSVLQRHWKKYALFGVLMVTTFLHITIVDAKETPQFDEDGDGNDFAEKIMNVDIKDESQFQERLVISHYCNYNCLV